MGWFSNIGKSLSNGLNSFKNDVSTDYHTVANDVSHNAKASEKKIKASIFTPVSKYVSSPALKDLGTVESDFNKGKNDVSQAVSKTAHSVYARMGSVISGTEKKMAQGVASFDSDMGNFGTHAYNDVSTIGKDAYNDVDTIGMRIENGAKGIESDITGGLSKAWNSITGWLKEFEIPIIVIVILVILIAMFIVLR